MLFENESFIPEPEYVNEECAESENEATEKDYLEKNGDRWTYHPKRSGKIIEDFFIVHLHEYDAYTLLAYHLPWDWDAEYSYEPIGFINDAKHLDDVDIMAWCRKCVKEYEKSKHQSINETSKKGIIVW